ncbi:MAG: hypothetical protein H6819_09365 [Phycisphaerales bacterium]|nr:hypothetical protein [Phycisphaerales bacterium]MCB9855440.1 hypothetical protein [Phycisphaerales bacterium]
MRSLSSIGLLLVTALIGASPPTTSAPATQATSTATTQSALTMKVRRLVAKLGDRNYRAREAAQLELKALGDAALPELVESLDDENPEISRRVQLLMRRPENPNLRVETVRRLIATGDPRLVEMGVYMLFKSPIEDYPLFKAVTDESSGVERAMFEPVCEQLGQWRRSTEIFESRQERLMAEKPDAAKREREMHEGSYYYQAEAAYWQAVEACEDYRERVSADHSASTKPAAHETPNASHNHE